jgi:crotonobetainyl-CoA:carnitine CoA-transferase CaiB-like acyl-CoA transferase
MSLPERAFAPRSFDPGAVCPLDGVRVVDLSRLVAGNAVSSHLADFGAEVLKIEDPVKGDPLRAWQSEGVSVHWKLYARNKKSVALALREVRGRELLLDLAASSEVLIENFRPGTLEKMGLGPAVLHERNPRLVIVRVSGWGQDGPYRDRPGFGTLVESMSGYAARTGFADREPVLPPTALADMVAGLYGAFAVMVALRRVEVEGGAGQIIDLPLLDPLFSFIATEAPIYHLTGAIRPRTGSRSETTSPRNVFRTSDGRYIGISASIQAMSERLFRAIGRADMISDPRFRTNTDRVQHAAECEAPIVEFIAARTIEENMALFAAAEVTAAPVYDIDQFLADPHVREREIVVDMPDEETGRLAMHNIIPRLSETPGHLRRPAPDLGEHTAEILGQFGIDRATLEGLAREGVIGLG